MVTDSMNNIKKCKDSGWGCFFFKLRLQKDLKNGEDKVILNVVKIYPSKIEELTYVKQVWRDLNGEIGSSTIIEKDFDTPFTSLHSSLRQKINKKQQLYVFIRPDGHDRFVQNIPSKCSRIYILLKCTWNFLKSTVSHMLVNNSLNKFRRLKFHESFSDYNGMKLQIDYRRELKKIKNICRLNNMLLNNYWSIEKSKESLRKISEDK